MANFWGELVLSLRVEQKISQRQLSVGAHVNRSTLRRIEEGPGGDIETIERLLDYLGYEMEAMSKASVVERLKRQAAETEDPGRKSKLAMARLLGMTTLEV
jgi:transcriptional regulator with XRE-family HTH domain